MVGMSITLALGISAMVDNDRVLGIVLLSSSALFGLCKALLLHSKVLYNHVLAPFILVVSLAGLMLYLVITGGVANTGPLWIYVLPPVAMFFAGVVYGVITVRCLLPFAVTFYSLQMVGLLLLTTPPNLSSACFIHSPR